MRNTDAEVLEEMVAKDYVVFAPKSGRDLRKDYKELWDYPELASLSESEVLFVWWYSCACSPYAHLPEEKRFPMSVDQSYKGAQRQEKKERWAPTGGAPSLPTEIKAACKVMEGFNPGMRIQMAVDNLYLLRECQQHIRQEERSSDQKDREDYLKTAKLARAIQAEILKDIEKGNHGVEEVKNTSLQNLEGLSAAYHKNKQ